MTLTGYIANVSTSGTVVTFSMPFMVDDDGTPLYTPSIYGWKGNPPNRRGIDVGVVTAAGNMTLTPAEDNTNINWAASGPGVADVTAAIPYCTADDLALRLSKQNLIELSSDDPASTEPNTDVIDALIAKAGTFIDGLLSGVYATPFSPTPVLINTICIDFTCYYLMQRRFSTMEMPKGWSDQYKASMDMLNQIGDLEVSLDTNPMIQAPEGEIVSEPKLVDFGDNNNLLSMF